MKNHIHESNLIEGFNDEIADQLSLIAWERLKDYSLLSAHNILKTHRLITVDQDDMPSRLLGNLRDYNVIVGGRPGAPYPILTSLMNAWINDMIDYRYKDPKEMHIRFEKIHPFADGNGRTGRMLMWWHEIKLGKEPTLILNAEKEEYYKWFEEKLMIEIHSNLSFTYPSNSLSR